MSAHWYWDWNWGGRSPTGGAAKSAKEETKAAKSGKAALTAHTPNQEAPDGVKPAPRGPCRKIAIFRGVKTPDPTVVRPGGAMEFILKEVDCQGNDYIPQHGEPPVPDPEYYWVTCKRAAPNCCTDPNLGCDPYLTRVQHPGGNPNRYITDFKCRCHDK